MEERRRRWEDSSNMAVRDIRVPSGNGGAVCSGPFDAIKTRLKAQSGEMKYKGMMHTFSTIYREEGLRALWKGLLPRLMRILPGGTIMCVADQVTGFYENEYINVRNNSDIPILGSS
ncbi:putative mitochondrial carrier domain superfamily [Helianthus debilis subsp. tardiflorus]